MKILNNIANKINLFIKQILIILLYLVLILTLNFMFLKLLQSSNLIILNLTNILIDLILLIVFLLIFRKIIIPQFEDFLKNKKSYISKYLKYYLIGLMIMIVSNAIINIFISMPINEEGNRQLLANLPVYSFITMVIISPIVEELMTRVYLKDAFKHQIIYVLLSGLIFGSLHMISIGNNLLQLLYIIPYGALGCALAKIYADANNIWVNIFYHSLHNLICILLIFIGSWL